MKIFLRLTVNNFWKRKYNLFSLSACIHEQRCRMISKCDRWNARLHREKSFLDIPRPYRTRPCAAAAFRNQFLAIAGVIIVKNIFESIHDSKVGRRLVLKGNRAEASMMKMYVTKCRKRVQARKFRVDVCRGCGGKMQLPCGPTFLQQFYVSSIVQIRRAIISTEAERNFDLLIKTISRNSRGSQSDRKVINNLLNSLHRFFLTNVR